MTEAIFYVDSEGTFWEQTSEAKSAAASDGLPLVHPELGGSQVYWRRVDPLAEAEAIRKRNQRRTNDRLRR